MTSAQTKPNRLQTEFQKGGIGGVTRWAGRWLYWNAGVHHLAPRELRRTYKQLKPHKKFNITAPILVYQMGKVGSTSVAKALVARDLDVPIYHLHHLNHLDNLAMQSRDLYRDPQELLRINQTAQRLRHEIETQPGRQWNVITLVRRPIERDVSAFFQGLRGIEPAYYTKFAQGALTLDDIRTLYLEHHYHQTAQEWFDRELRAVFGIDVYAAPFPQNDGYAIYENTRARVLLIRLEDLERCAPAAMRDFIGIPDFQLVAKNVGEQKGYQNIYSQFVRTACFPDEFIEMMRHNRYAQHFYSGAELDKESARWRCKPTPSTP